MSDKPEILLTANLLKSCQDALDKHFTVHRWYNAPDKKALLAEVAPRIRGIAASGGGFDAELYDALPNLEVISCFGVGYDGVKVDVCKSKNVRVSNTPDVLTDAMAEITLGLMIALARKIPQTDVYMREGRWGKEGDYPLQAELTGRLIGIVGLGRIGKEVARRAQAFKMRVYYHGRRPQQFEPYPYFADLTEMAKKVDWLVSIVPGGASTSRIINAEVLDALGPEGFFVNVGRGSSVDEAALLAALKSNTIAGAALDVFDNEPNADPEFFGLENVVLSPHQGSATEKTRWMMGDLVVRNLVAHFDGEPLISPVA